MTGALGRWRTSVAEQLRSAGLEAVEAMGPERAARVRGPVAAVALAGAACGPGGFQDYLGAEETQGGGSREVYGRWVELTLRLDVFAPRDGGAPACRAAAEQAAEELLFRGAAGLPVAELTAGETEFLERDGLYRLAVRCRCGAWLTARADEETGALTDFEVRGTMR